MRKLHSGLRRTTPTNNYPFAHGGSIPVGSYTSVIDAIEETVTKAGTKAIDVSYTLTNSDGHRYHMRLRAPFQTPLYEEFATAMFAAGATEDTAYEDLVGIHEEVTLAYNDHDFAEFSLRKPLGVPSKACRSDEDELEEDYLSIDDDED